MTDKVAVLAEEGWVVLSNEEWEQAMKDHLLKDTVMFDEQRVGWHSTEHGGKTPIYEPVTPYWLWYCYCGAIGGRRATQEAAVSAHETHKESS
jgi:hypothetical protein